MSLTQERLARFEANRPRLFGLAYRLLGEASEAEDVVQDAYLRWARSDVVVSPEALLTKVVANLCLNRLTSARAKRERYVGAWLPEPVLTGEGAGTGALGPLETVEQREWLSLGMLVLLERLTPPERAVFVPPAGSGPVRGTDPATVTVDMVNGEPAFVTYQDGRLFSIMVPRLDGDRIVAFHSVTNPDKLAFTAKQSK